MLWLYLWHIDISAAESTWLQLDAWRPWVTGGWWCPTSTIDSHSWLLGFYGSTRMGTPESSSQVEVYSDLVKVILLSSWPSRHQRIKDPWFLLFTKRTRNGSGSKPSVSKFQQDNVTSSSKRWHIKLTCTKKPWKVETQRQPTFLKGVINTQNPQKEAGFYDPKLF